MVARSTLKKIAQYSVLGQRLYRAYRRREARQYVPDWERILGSEPGRWEEARRAAASGKRILLATGAGGHPAPPLVDSLLAVALTLRGAAVHFSVCDRALPACLMAEVGLMPPRRLARRGPQSYFCWGCFERADALYAPLSLPVHRQSRYCTSEEVEEAQEVAKSLPLEQIPAHRVDDVAVGEHALAGALRFFARASLDGQAAGEAVLRRYLQAAMLTLFATRRLLRKTDCECVCVNHGIYVPHGIVAEVARREGRRLVAWNVAYRKRCFIFSHSDTYHHTLMNEPAAAWENIPWSAEREDDIVQYLRSRRRGGRDWIAFQSQRPKEERGEISRDLAGIDWDRPCVGMLTNVAWDAQLHYPANVFRNMFEWLVQTVEFFAKRDDLQLIIRVHPAEVSGDIPSRQKSADELRTAFPQWPRNVFVIPPSSRVSTYAVMDACNAVIIYGTKTGVELTSMGIPVIVAGEAWIRNRGVTIDARSREEYFRTLERLPFPSRMEPTLVERARKYAYHFFFRRMIPVDQVAPTGVEPPFHIAAKDLRAFEPGRSKGLDVICDGILTGSPFIYPAEEYGIGRE